MADLKHSPSICNLLLLPLQRPAGLAFHAGSLFQFKKDQADYSIKPEDYATKPIFVAANEFRLIDGFFLHVLCVHDIHKW